MLFFIPPYAGFATSAATASYTAGGIDSANKNNYSFAGISIGTAATDRLVAVAIVEGASAGTDPTSVTVGGISATKIASTNDGSNVTTTLWYAAVPTGTTATIAVNNGVTRQFCRVDAFRIVGQSSSTPYYFNTVLNAGSSTVLTLTPGYVLSDGATIACSAAPAVNSTYTWAGLSEDYDTATEATNARVSGASGTGFAAAITATISGAATGLMGIIAMWR